MALPPLLLDPLPPPLLAAGGPVRHLRQLHPRHQGLDGGHLEEGEVEEEEEEEEGRGVW